MRTELTDEETPSRGLPRRAVASLALLMVFTALVSGVYSHRLTHKEVTRNVNLEEVIPTQFAGWRVVSATDKIVVNPQVQEVIDRLYSKVLERTYASPDGYLVMLSIAHGDKQREGFSAHMPELCYAASGFAVGPTTRGELHTAGGRLDVKRLDARLGNRYEPITYWFRLGDQTLGGGSSLQQRMTELRFALSGNVPEGVLVRLSSIDPQRERAYERHARFAADLLAAVSPDSRQYLVGTPRQ